MSVNEINLGDHKIQIEVNRWAKQANGSAVVRCGDDVVLVTVVCAHEASNQDFFPLTVEYQERFYSSGRIPGGFFKREGRPSQESILSARVMDRFMRPCFPEGFRYDTQIVATVLSYSGNFPVEILAGIGASTCLHISDIPFEGPVTCLQVARIDGKFTLNPSSEILKKADLNLILAGNRSGILMVEGESSFVQEKDLLEALKWGHEKMQVLFDFQDDLRKKMGSQKRDWKPAEKDQSLKQELEKSFADQTLKALTVSQKVKRSEALRSLKKEILNQFNLQDEEKEKLLIHFFENLKYQLSRELILKKNIRIDGRKLDEIRPIECETGVLPRTHGSGLFTRGETQVLGTVTLGTVDDEQMLDQLSGSSKKRFLLHYNFPPYSVGETGRLGGQSRREIGHGFLAEKALRKMIPNEEKFPYTLRIVSEVLESNGSSSMGTVCASSLALMDAGVPLSSAVSGIAMGLIQEGSQTAILSDILGDEDHLGDMDFKVAGTKEGITAVQMDIKIKGLSFDIIEKALEQAHKGRLHILDCMNQVISENKNELSSHAPRIEKFKIPTDKIREVIGSGGKVIQSIIKDTGVKMTIEDDGTVHIASSDQNSLKKAKGIVDKICEDVEKGKTYEGKVKKIAEYGAFVEILPNKTGLLHISEIATERIDKVSSYLKEGQEVTVKVLGIENGKIRLSRKALL